MCLEYLTILDAISFKDSVIALYSELLSDTSFFGYDFIFIYKNHHKECLPGRIFFVPE